MRNSWHLWSDRPSAAGWKTEGVVPKSNAEITELGRRYAEMAEGEGKKELLLELCQAFHPLLMKYLVMICRLPAAQNLHRPARAWKRTDRAVRAHRRRIRPRYANRIRTAVEIINRELSKRNQFAAADGSRHLDVDSSRYLRMLYRHGFLAPSQEEEDGISEESRLAADLALIRKQTRPGRQHGPPARPIERTNQGNHYE